jgi:hypothetical protein
MYMANVKGRVIQNMVKVMLSALLVFSAVSCDIPAGNYDDENTGKTLSIFLGDAGNGSRAISTAAPSFPTFSTVVINVTKGGAVVASGTFSGNGPHTISVPDGSGYRVELDAQVASPVTFGRRYAGAVDSVSTGNPVYVQLSVSETAVVGRDSAILNVYSSFASNSPDRTLSGSLLFFFDRYGRLFTYDMSGTFSMFSNIGDTAGQQATLSGVTSITDMAHSAGSDIVYLWGLYNGGPLVADFAFIRLSDMAGGAITYTPITITPSSFPPPYTGFTVKRIGVSDDGTVFLGGAMASNDTAFIKGTVDTGTNTFTFIGGTTVPTIDDNALSDMKVINGTLCLLGSQPGFSDREVLSVYNADTLTFLGSALIQSPLLITGMMGRLAGWGKDSVYAYYVGFPPLTSGIVEIGTTNVTISDRKDW